MAVEDDPGESFDTTALDVRLRMPLLRRNDVGENTGYTRRMKQMLNEVNEQVGGEKGRPPDLPPLHIDGDLGYIFGPKTEAAVKRFQSDNSLPQTGQVDKATWHLLLRLWLSDFSAG